MSTDWIKMRVDLREDPAVFRLSKLTKLDRLSVVGRLWAFWSWADKHAVNGRIDGADAADVDEISDKKGFAHALSEVGWLAIGDGFVAIPKHDRHTGESAKERSLKNARQARWRQSRDAAVDMAVDAPPSTSGDAEASTQPSTREEKSREEKKQPSVVARAARLPTDWDPGEPGWAFAAAKGLTNGVAQGELEKFRDHWTAKPGKDGTALDWQAKWRTWVRNSLEFRARAGKPPDLDDIFRRGQA